jgi:hypothetical protein
MIESDHAPEQEESFAARRSGDLEKEETYNQTPKEWPTIRSSQNKEEKRNEKKTA